MDGEVDITGKQRVLDLLHEQTLAADLGEAGVREPVARRLDDDDFARHAGAGSEERRDGVRLIQRQLAAASPKPQRVHDQCERR